MNEDIHEQLEQAALASRCLSSKIKPNSDNAAAKREKRLKFEQIIKNIAGIMAEMDLPGEAVNPKMRAGTALDHLTQKMSVFIAMLQERVDHTPPEGEEALSCLIQKLGSSVEMVVKGCDMGQMDTESEEEEEEFPKTKKAKSQDGNPGSARIVEALAVQPAPEAAQDLPVVSAIPFQPAPEAAQDLPVVSAIPFQPAPEAAQDLPVVPVLPIPTAVPVQPALPVQGSVPDWRESGPAPSPVPKEKVLDFEQAKALQEKRRAQEAKAAQKEDPAPIQAVEAPVNIQPPAPPPIHAQAVPENAGQGMANDDDVQIVPAPAQDIVMINLADSDQE